MTSLKFNFYIVKFACFECYVMIITGCSSTNKRKRRWGSLHVKRYPL